MTLQGGVGGKGKEGSARGRGLLIKGRLCLPIGTGALPDDQRFTKVGVAHGNREQDHQRYHPAIVVHPVKGSVSSVCVFGVSGL